MLEDRVMFRIVGASYWNGSQGALWGVIFFFFHLEDICMSVLRFWNAIKMYTCFLRLCVHAVLQWKFTQTSNQTSKQTNPWHSHILLANSPEPPSSSVTHNKLLESSLPATSVSPFFSPSPAHSSVAFCPKTDSHSDHQFPRMLNPKT